MGVLKHFSKKNIFFHLVSSSSFFIFSFIFSLLFHLLSCLFFFILSLLSSLIFSLIFSFIFSLLLSLVSCLLSLLFSLLFSSLVSPLSSSLAFSSCLVLSRLLFLCLSFSVSLCPCLRVLLWWLLLLFWKLFSAHVSVHTRLILKAGLV